MSPSVEPFDEVKYKVLMDGLECIELPLSHVFGTYDFRMESEFYKRDYMSIQAKLNRLRAKRLNEGLAECITDGTHYTPDYKDAGIPFLSAMNVQENILDLDAGYKYISPKQHQELCRRVLPRANDVLLRKVGVGKRKACVVPQNMFEFSIFVSIALIRPRINPYYLSVYMNSKFGQTQLLRFNKGISQPDLHLEDIERMLVPLFSDKFMSEIETCFKNAMTNFDNSRKAYQSALQTLEELLDFQLPHPVVNDSVKSFRSSFFQNGRLDAEYYQSKYDVLFEMLSKFPTASLGGENGLVTIKKSIEPGSEAYQENGIPFLRVSDISKFEISSPDIKLPKNIIPDVESLYPKKETILLSKDGSIGIAYKVQKDMEAITSGALLHLTVRDNAVVLPDYLTLVLNSAIVQLQAERDANGAIIRHWKPSDIEKVIIPVLNMDVQENISKKIQESFEMRTEAKRLFELAQKAVEMAVDMDEGTAFSWLRRQEGKEAG